MMSIMLIPLFVVIGEAPFMMFGFVAPVIVFVVIFCFIGLMVGTTAAQVKKFPTFDLVLDKVTNKMSLYAWNPYLRSGNYKMSILSRMGQYLTTAWDLDKILFRLIAPNERTGPGMIFYRGRLKNSWLVMYDDPTWLHPNLLLASVNAELAQALMRTLDNFLQGTNGYKMDVDEGLLAERPFP